MTTDDAVQWMLERFARNRCLYQDEAASNFLHLKDSTLAYYDANGNVCIAKDILRRFNDATPDAVYERADKFWRPRLPTDQPGRQQ